MCPDLTGCPQQFDRRHPVRPRKGGSSNRKRAGRRRSRRRRRRRRWRGWDGEGKRKQRGGCTQLTLVPSPVSTDLIGRRLTNWSSLFFFVLSGLHRSFMFVVFCVCVQKFFVLQHLFRDSTENRRNDQNYLALAAIISKILFSFSSWAPDPMEPACHGMRSIHNSLFRPGKGLEMVSRLLFFFFFSLSLSHSLTNSDWWGGGYFQSGSYRWEFS